MGNTLGNLVALVVTIICIVVSIFSFGAGAITLIVVAYGSFLFFWIGDALSRPARGGKFLLMMSDVEFAAFRKYHLYIRFPGAGQAMSAFLNALRIAGIAWGALSLWQGEYWLGALLLGYFFVVGFACLRFDPATYMLRQANAGHELARRELMLIERVHDTLELFKEAAAPDRRAKGGDMVPSPATSSPVIGEDPQVDDDPDIDDDPVIDNDPIVDSDPVIDDAPTSDWEAYYRDVEAFVKKHGRYDRLLTLQATDREFGVASLKVYRAGYLTGQPATLVGALLMDSIKQYTPDRRLAVYFLMALEEQFHAKQPDKGTRPE